MMFQRVFRLALCVAIVASLLPTSALAASGCYHPDDHHCDCRDSGTTQSTCEQGKNIWTEECNCDEGTSGTDTTKGEDDHQQSDAGGGGAAFTPASPDEDAATARWILQEALWGTVTTSSRSPLEPSKKEETEGNEPTLSATILPFAADRASGRLFLYLLGEQHLHAATLTVSQASLNAPLFAIAGCGLDSTSVVDAQDPRCIKLSVSGAVHPCTDSNSVPADCEAVGIAALFHAHPSMKDWPEDHNFVVHELIILEQEGLWMLANFGGGGVITRELYHGVEDDAITPHAIEGGMAVYVPPPKGNGSPSDMPRWIHRAERARWLVHHGLWTTISTVHSADGSSTSTFGNIRSVTDGGIKASDSTGLPVFYVPDVDPTAIDLMEHGMALALTFTEAALVERVTTVKHDHGDGVWTTCAGQDVGMPTCAQVTLYGTAVVLATDSVEYQGALSQFAESHPLASWLAGGGSHMAGQYYTIEPTRVALLDFFGGVVDVPIEEYLAVSPVVDVRTGDVHWVDDVLDDSNSAFLASFIPWVFGILFGCLIGWCSHKYCSVRKESLRNNTYEKIGGAGGPHNGENRGSSYTDQGPDAVSLDEEAEEFADEA